MNACLSASWQFGLDCRAKGKRSFASVSTEGAASEAGASKFPLVVSVEAGWSGYSPDTGMIRIWCRGLFHSEPQEETTTYGVIDGSEPQYGECAPNGKALVPAHPDGPPGGTDGWSRYPPHGPLSGGPRGTGS